jgi:hypothetical protein
MYKEFDNKFGFVTSDDDDIQECKGNSLIVPRLRRYMGMGVYQILANVKNVNNKFFLLTLGGPNGYDVDANKQFLNNLTINDAISVEKLRDELSQQSWSVIENTTIFDGGELHNVQEYHQ